ncbi:MAG: holo-ACP synthase CitX [Desulfuromonadales bacterium C00003068]|nr:MAG: holo-ACP synthase CitX [Desulfuromonadales bacterium C00003068]
MTVSAELKSDLLAARDLRQLDLNSFINTEHNTVIMMALNIPGPDKLPAGGEALMAWGRRCVEVKTGAHCVVTNRDAAGLYMLFVCDLAPQRCKELAVKIEEQTPAARLLDVDIYTNDGDQLGRANLGFKARRCLLCERPAVECMRTGNHEPDAIVQSAQQRLSTFIN